MLAVDSNHVALLKMDASHCRLAQFTAQGRRNHLQHCDWLLVNRKKFHQPALFGVSGLTTEQQFFQCRNNQHRECAMQFAITNERNAYRLGSFGKEAGLYTDDGGKHDGNRRQKVAQSIWQSQGIDFVPAI